jgi:hypothetical protein
VEKYFLKFSLGVVLSFVLTFTIGCGVAGELVEEKGVEDGFNLSQGSLNKSSDGSLSGTGGYRFLKTAPTTNSTQALNIRSASLPTAFSKLEIVFFTNQPMSFADGVHIVLSRNPLGSVSGTIQINRGDTRQIPDFRLQRFNPDQFDIVVEVKGRSSSAEVRLYNVTSGGDIIREFDSVTDLNPALPTNFNLPGTMMGFVFTNSKVGSARFRNPISP